MNKDFKGWCARKELLDRSSRKKYCNEREIWWCYVGVNIGFEEDGGEEFRRPVLVLKSMSSDTCLIAPLTSSTNKHPLRPSLGSVQGSEARAILSQIRVIDVKRLVYKIGRLDKERFEVIRKTLRDLL